MLDIYWFRKERVGTVDIVVDNECARLGEHHRQEILQRANKLQETDLRAREVDDGLTKFKAKLKLFQKGFGKRPPSQAERVQLVEMKQHVKGQEKALAGLRTQLTDELSRFGNFLDPICGKACCSMQVDVVCDEYEKMVCDVAYFKQALSSSAACCESSKLDHLAGKWFQKEDEQLPFLIDSDACNPLLVVCAGDLQASRFVCMQFLRRGLEIMRNQGVHLVEAKPSELQLGLCSSINIIHTESGEKLMTVSNEGDFRAGDLGIRSGPKKQLQDKKKFVHTVIVDVNFSNLVKYCAWGKKQWRLLGLSGSLEDSVAQTRKSPMTDVPGQLSYSDLDIFENWLKRHSFACGFTFSQVDEKMYQSLRLSGIKVLGVQYPHVARWIRNMESRSMDWGE